MGNIVKKKGLGSKIKEEWLRPLNTLEIILVAGIMIVLIFGICPIIYNISDSNTRGLSNSAHVGAYERIRDEGGNASDKTAAMITMAENVIASNVHS